MKKESFVSDATHVKSRRAAAEYLRQLLLKPGHYREAWEQHVARPRDGVINQLAVAQVIADRLYRSLVARRAGIE